MEIPNKAKYMANARQWKSTGGSKGGDSTLRRHKNWFGKNAPKGAGMGDGKKAGK